MLYPHLMPFMYGWTTVLPSIFGADYRAVDGLMSEWRIISESEILIFSERRRRKCRFVRWTDVPCANVMHYFITWQCKEKRTKLSEWEFFCSFGKNPFNFKLEKGLSLLVERRTSLNEKKNSFEYSFYAISMVIW